MLLPLHFPEHWMRIIAQRPRRRGLCCTLEFALRDQHKNGPRCRTRPFNSWLHSADVWEPTRRLELLTCCLQIRGWSVPGCPLPSICPMNPSRLAHTVCPYPAPSTGLATALATVMRGCASAWRRANTCCLQALPFASAPSAALFSRLDHEPRHRDDRRARSWIAIGEPRGAVLSYPVTRA